MKLEVQSIHFDADQKLVDYVNQKCKKLDKYFDNITDAQVYLKVEKEKAHGNKIFEIKMNVPNEQLIAKEKGDKFEEACDLAVENLKRQLVKYKEKLRA